MLGISYKIIATVFFTFMASLVSIVSKTLPVGEIVFFRCYLALIPLIIWLIYKGNLRSIYQTDHPKKHIVRASNSFIGMYLGFLALVYIPLTDQVALLYAAPLITIPLAVIFLKEKIGIYRWSAVFIGLIGVLVILYPYLTTSARQAGAIIGVVACMIAAVSYAFGAIIVRSLSSTESMAATVFYFSIICGAVSLVTVSSWVMPNAQTWLLLVAIGILGGLGQMVMTMAFHHADATLIAPFEYVSIIWASILGYLLFGQIPTLYTVVGSCIVICAGLIVILRERHLKIKRQAILLKGQ